MPAKLKSWVFKLNSIETKFISLGLLFGAAIGVARAQSYSDFLVHVDALWTLPALLLSELIYLPIIRAPRVNERLAPSIATTGLVFSVLFFLNGFNPNAIVAALVFFVITGLIRNLVRWMLTEISLLHMGRLKANELSYFISAALDLGSIFAVGATIIFKADTITNLMMVGLLWSSLFLFTWYLFNHHESFEIKLASEEFPGSSQEPFFIRKVSHAYISLCLLIGFFYAIQEYVWRSNLQELVTNKADYVYYTTVYVIGSNLLGVISGWFAAQATRRTRISPEKIIHYFMLASALGLLVFSITRSILGAVFLGIVCSATFRNFFIAANTNLMSCFDDKTRSDFRKLGQMALFIAPLAPVFGLSFLIQQLAPDSKIMALAISLGGLLLTAIYFSKRYILHLTNLMYLFLHSHDRIRRVNGAMLLSFLRPKGYDQWFKDILAQKPKTLLIKTIIESLAFHPTKKSIKLITSQFSNPKEEIKFAICDALNRINKPQSISFLLGIALNKNESFRVRQKAVKLLYRRMKVHLISVFLNRLETAKKDERRIIIEGLSEIQNPELFHTFLSNLDDTRPDIIKFALIGLYKSSDNRLAFTEKINELIREVENPMFGIACFVLGEVRDDRWLPTIRSLRLKNKSNIIFQSWYMYRIDESLKKEQIVLIRNLIKDQSFQKELVNLFVYFNPRDRIKILYSLVVNAQQLDLSITKLINLLKDFDYDFHEEVLFLLNLKNRQGDRTLLRRTG
ncbi:MAG: hypothetical protein JNL11_06760 [Bdellovibrionaceae bacterium]|nr:hypothetical protein [Pseudobdellovibrionaceae bacterium]